MQSVYAERFIRAALGLLFAALILTLLLRLPPTGPIDPGLSLQTNRPAALAVQQALPRTLSTLGIGIGLGLPLALLLGIPAGLRPGSLLDRLLQGPAVALAGVPAFTVALMAVLFLSVKTRFTGMTTTGLVTLTLLFGLWMARAVQGGVAAARVDGARPSAGRAALGTVGRILQQSGNLLIIAGLVGQISPGGEILWRMSLTAAFQRDYPVVYAALWALVLIILAGHLLGDLLVTASERGKSPATATGKSPATATVAVQAPGWSLSRSWLAVGVALFALLLLTAGTGWGDAVTLNLQNRLQPPGPGHLLGTDQYGRDFLNRIGSGARTSLAIAAMASFVAAVGGAVLAGLGRVTGRWGVALLSPRIAVPSLFTPLVAGLVGTLLFRPSVALLILVLGLASIPAMAHAFRPLFQSIGASGAPTRALAATAGLILLTFAQILMAEVTLSYLGIGVQPPVASLGNVIYENMNYIVRSPHLLWSLLPSALGLAGLFLTGHALAEEEI